MRKQQKNRTVVVIKICICTGDGITEVNSDISELCFIVFYSSEIYYIENLNCMIVYIAKYITILSPSDIFKVGYIVQLYPPTYSTLM